MRILYQVGIFWCLWFWSPMLLAQPGVWQSAGAGSAATARAQAGVTGDFWNLFGNPAGLADLKGFHAGTHAEQRFALKELSSGQVGMALPFAENQALGLKVSWFGMGEFGEGRYGLAYAISPLPGFRIGSSVNWYQTVIPTQGSGTSLYLDLGLQVDLSPTLTVGSFASNVNRAELSDLGESNPLPTLIQAGLAFRPTPQLALLLDVLHEIDGSISPRAGIDYQPGEVLSLRIGVQTGPTALSGGFGLDFESLRIDIAAGYQPLLGFTPHLALTYGWNHPQK